VSLFLSSPLFFLSLVLSKSPQCALLNPLCLFPPLRVSLL
jgi:hypothetical protein